MSGKRLSTLLTGLIFWGGVFASSAFAQRGASEASGEIERLLQESKVSYDELDLDRAEDALARAVQIAEQFGIRNIALAEVLVQRGVVIFVRDKNSTAALKNFVEALEVDDRVGLDPLTGTPSLERLFQEARNQVRPRPASNFRNDRSPPGGGGWGGGSFGRDSAPSGGQGDGRRQERESDRYRAPPSDGGRGYREKPRYPPKSDRRPPPENDFRAGRGDDRRESGFRDRGRPPPRDEYNRGERPEERQQRPAADLVHQPAASVEGGRALSLALEVAPRINRQVYRVFVYFRSASGSEIQRLEMQPSGQNTFQGRIPRRYLVGRELSYYFQAENRRQDIVAQAGSARQPFRLPITGDSGVPAGFAGGSSLDGDSGRRSSDGASPRQFFGATLNLGTGFGYVKGDARPVNNPNADVSQPGIGPSSFHLLIELDLWLSDTFAFGPFARLQLGDFAHLEGGRIKFKVSESGNHSFRMRGGGGYGRVAHLVQLKQGFDYTLEGPFLFTVGMTYRYQISDVFSVVLSPDYLQLFGEFASYHLDLQAGIELGL